MAFQRTRGTMTFSEAVEILRHAERQTLKDRAFGDREVSWFKDDQEVASGYFGHSKQSIVIQESKFIGETAYCLERHFKTSTLEYNE